MEYSITPAEEHQYIYIRVVGDIDRDVSMRINLEAHALGRRLGINTYWMDLTASCNRDTVLGNYHFAYRDMRETPGIDRSARVLVLVAPADHSHDFIETVARNSGINLTLYRDRASLVNNLRSLGIMVDP